MIMYKAAVIFSNYWFDYSIFLFYENAPKMIPFILAGVILTLVIIAALLILSSSLKLQVLLVKFANRWFKRPKLRDWVDNCNLQIYSWALSKQLHKIAQRCFESFHGMYLNYYFGTLFLTLF